MVNPARPMPAGSLVAELPVGAATGGYLLVAERLLAEVSLLVAELVLFYPIRAPISSTVFSP